MAQHTIFQLNSTSPRLSAKDVRDALSKTSNMTPYKRLKYFHDKGIHYRRSMKYLVIVEQLNCLYEYDRVLPSLTSKIDEDTFWGISVTQSPKTPPKMTIQEMSLFINELLKDYDA